MGIQNLALSFSPTYIPSTSFLSFLYDGKYLVHDPTDGTVGNIDIVKLLYMRLNISCSHTSSSRVLHPVHLPEGRTSCHSWLPFVGLRFFAMIIPPDCVVLSYISLKVYTNFGILPTDKGRKSALLLSLTANHSVKPFLHHSSFSLSAPEIFIIFIPLLKNKKWPY